MLNSTLRRLSFSRLSKSEEWDWSLKSTSTGARSKSLRNNNESSRSKTKWPSRRLFWPETGLPPSDEYDLTDDVPFQAAPDLSFEDALKQAFERRTDIKAAEAQIHAAEHTLAAARDERLPSLTVNGDYGGIGTNPSQAHTTYLGAATLNVPIWLGGRTEGEITEAKAGSTEG